MTRVNAELMGNVWKIEVAVGDRVAEDDTLIIMESMKMEIPVVAPVAGTVAALHVAEGDTVQDGAPLVDID